MKYPVFAIAMLAISLQACQKQPQSQSVTAEFKRSSSETAMNKPDVPGCIASAKKLLQDVEREDVEAIHERNAALMLASLPIIESVSAGHAECADYLQKAKAVVDLVDTISHEHIEAQYHHDGALPKAPLNCYHTKDLLVHPATVVVLLREKGSTAGKSEMKAEVEEVVEHAGEVVALIPGGVSRVSDTE